MKRAKKSGPYVQVTTCFVEWPVAMEICNWFSYGTMDVLLCTQFVFMNFRSHVDARMCNRL
jgi:hypothetical protein